MPIPQHISQLSRTQVTPEQIKTHRSSLSHEDELSQYLWSAQLLRYIWSRASPMHQQASFEGQTHLHLLVPMASAADVVISARKPRLIAYVGLVHGWRRLAAAVQTVSCSNNGRVLSQNRCIIDLLKSASTQVSAVRHCSLLV